MAFSRQMGIKLATRILSKSKITNVQFVRIASLSTRIPLVHGLKQVNSYIQSRSRPFQLLKNEYATNEDAENLDQVSFENICSETLESLTEYFEELVETEQKLANAEVSYSSGVLNIDLGNHGTYVINRQSPNKQIWLSSPVSGPKRYDYIPKNQCWVYKRDVKTLHQLLQSEISEILGDKIDISKCAHSNFRH